MGCEADESRCSGHIDALSQLQLLQAFQDLIELLRIRIGALEVVMHRPGQGNDGAFDEAQLGLQDLFEDVRNIAADVDL